MINSITLSFIFSALLLSHTVDALDGPLSYNLRNLQREEGLSLDSSFVARYHNKGLEHLLKNKEAFSSFPVMAEATFLFLEEDEGFPDFDSEEAMTSVEKTFIVSRDGTADAEATLYQALKEEAAASPVIAEIIDVIEKVKSEQITSVDEMVRAVQSAAEKSGESTDLQVSDVFGAVAKASEEFWTTYLEPSEEVGGGRRALKRCKWWQKLLIILADAAGAAYGAAIGAPISPLHAVIYAVIYGVLMSVATQQAFDCTWRR